MILELDPKKITPSPSNPRKRGLLDGIDDLTESVRAKGLLQPIVVRPVKMGHELVFGHRRREAAIRAELATVPCIVREYSDDEVLEVQIVENLEREDVHPLDEAEGFAELVKRGRTVQQIAEKVGRPASFVAQRMKLLELTKDAREALDNQQITLAVAMVIARVPAKLQDEALDRVIGERDWQTGEPCSAARALEIVKKDFVLRLTLAKFQTDDALLAIRAFSLPTSRPTTFASIPPATDRSRMPPSLVSRRTSLSGTQRRSLARRRRRP
jgi:ParB/RepB/Spo0J family partition protein